MKLCTFSKMYFSDVGLTFRKCEFFIPGKREKWDGLFWLNTKLVLKEKQASKRFGRIPCYFLPPYHPPCWGGWQLWRFPEGINFLNISLVQLQALALSPPLPPLTSDVWSNSFKFSVRSEKNIYKTHLSFIRLQLV